VSRPKTLATQALATQVMRAASGRRAAARRVQARVGELVSRALAADFSSEAGVENAYA
jgi:hypothetical protein